MTNKLKLCEETYDFLMGYLAEHGYKKASGELLGIKSSFEGSFRDETVSENGDRFDPDFVRRRL